MRSQQGTGPGLVLFDIDGVLADVREGRPPGHTPAALEYLAGRLGWSAKDKARALAHLDGLFEPLMTGAIDPYDAFESLGSVGLPVPPSCAASAYHVHLERYMDGYGVFPGVRQVLEQLRSFGLTLATLSDRYLLAAQAAEEYLLYESLDYHFDSCLIGVTKNSEDAFRFALEVAGFSPERTLYLDDKLDLVLRAERLGMRGVLVLGVRGQAADWRRRRDEQPEKYVRIERYLSEGGRSIESVTELPGRPDLLSLIGLSA